MFCIFPQFIFNLWHSCDLKVFTMPSGQGQSLLQRNTYPHSESEETITSSVKEKVSIIPHRTIYPVLVMIPETVFLGHQP